MKNSLLFVCLFSFSIFSSNYYVSTSGNDANDGKTVATAWRHISFATCGGVYGCSCTVANSNIIKAGDTLFIKGGIYHEHSINIVNSGTSSKPIVIKSFPGESATINGDSVSQTFCLGINNAISYVVFDNLHLIHGQIAGFRIGHNFATSFITIQNCFIETTKANDNTGGVYLDNANDVTINNCKIIGDGNTNANNAGIILFSGNRLTIINCDISNAYLGVYFKFTTVGGGGKSLIRNNFIHDNNGEGLYLTSNDIVLHNNLIVNNGNLGVNIWGSAGAYGGSNSRLDHNTIYNQKNTMLVSWGSGYNAKTGDHGAKNDTIVDNILFGSNGEYGSYSIWAYAPDSAFLNPTKDSSNYNCYFNSATSNVMRWQDKTSTLQDWQIAHPSLDTRSIQASPKFTNTSGKMNSIKDFVLLSGPGFKVASDGKDMGADISSILRESPTIIRAGGKSGSSDTVIGILNDATFYYKLITTGSPYKFTVTPSTMPFGLKFNDSTGAISGTPKDTGLAILTFTATNEYGVSPNFTLIIHVSASAVPVIVRSDGKPGTIDTANGFQNDSTFSYKINATGVPTKFSITPNSLPSALKFDSTSGKLSGTPKDTGSTLLTLSASNNKGKSAAFTLLIHIIIKPIPLIRRSDGNSGTADTIIGYQKDSTINYKIVATNSPTLYAAAGLPSGVTLSAQAGAITGTLLDTGTFKASLTATNNYGSSLNFNLVIRINPLPVPVIARSDGSKGSVDTIFGSQNDSTFTYKIAVTNGAAQFTTTSLPAGFKIDAKTGIITGTPRDTGVTSVTLTASNNYGASSSFTLIIRIIKIAVPILTGQSFAHAIVGRAFYYKIASLLKPDSFYVSGLPKGLSLNDTLGVITGTISALSAGACTLSAKNSKGASLPFPLKIFMIDTANFGNQTPLSSGSDYHDTFSINDTGLQGTNITLLAGPGDKAPSLVVNGISNVKTALKQGICVTVGRSLIDESKGFRAWMIVSDALKIDTIVLSRPIVRVAGNCDDFATQPLAWVPVSVTALPDARAAKQKLSGLFTDKGEYDKQKCRLLQWVSSIGDSGHLAEYGTIADSLFDFRPGRLFWMKARDSVQINFGRATTMALNDTFKLTLYPNNWTDFSFPYLFPVRLNDIFSATQTKSGTNFSDSLEFYSWKKSGVSTITEPFYLARIPGVNSKDQALLGGIGKAYTIFNPSKDPITIYFPPTCSIQTAPVMLKASAKQQTPWVVRINCHDGFGNPLSSIYCGGDEKLAKSVYYATPPSFLSTSLAVIDSTTGKSHGSMVSNSKVNKGILFSFILSNNSSLDAKYTVAIDSLIGLPENMKATLFGANMSNVNAYGDKLSISLGKNTQQTLYLGVGPAGYLNKLGINMAMVPGLGSMYPNPFKTHLSVQYVVPFRIVESIHFSLTDLQGKCVWEQTQSKPQSGMHEFRFNRNAEGKFKMASGVYMFNYSILDNQNQILRFTKRVFCL